MQRRAVTYFIAARLLIWAVIAVSGFDALVLLDVPTLTAYGAMARAGHLVDLAHEMDPRFHVVGLVVWASIGVAFDTIRRSVTT